MSSPAPIIVFAFNRLDCLKKTIKTILLNEEAKDSDLFVFVDGPRKHKVGEEDKVIEVRNFVSSIKGFKSVTHFFSEKNKGLGPSIIDGVSKVINHYGYAIVLEDDLQLSKTCLSYFNQGLDKYKDNPTVFSICGYSSLVNKPSYYSASTYFCTRSSSWGWATWADRWNCVDWELNNWDQYKKYKSAFNKWGGSDCWKMLNDWRNGKNKSWAIRFCFSQFMQNKVSLFPIKSLISNDGFDGNGTNCKQWSRFKCELDTTGKKDFIWPDNTEIDPELYKEAMKYHTIWIRLYSRIMYVISDLKK